ncbi:MAG: hypothetical protein AB7G23_00620 [Vicinamibacterales bacterium]
MSRAVTALLALLLAAAGAAAQTPTPLDQAKALYAEASYAEALALLDRSEFQNGFEQVHQYRALCLLGLGRSDEALASVKLAVAADPFFVPAAADVPPRLIAMFDAARAELLPDRARDLFTEARELFQGGDLVRARPRFETALRLLNDPVVEDDADLADLRLLVSGFVDLTKSTEAMEAEQAAAEKEAAAPPAVEAAAPPVVRPAVPIDQELPPWRPPNREFASVSFSGAIRVFIGVDGRVTSAAMDRPVHPTYDPALLAAARSWRYEPATQDGRPVPSERVVIVDLRPNQ